MKLSSTSALHLYRASQHSSCTFIGFTCFMVFPASDLPAIRLTESTHYVTNQGWIKMVYHAFSVFLSRCDIDPDDHLSLTLGDM